MEAEALQILEEATGTQENVRLGSLLFEIGRRVKLSDEEFGVFERVRNEPRDPSTAGHPRASEGGASG